MVTLYQDIEHPHRDGLRDLTYVRRDPEHTIAVQITPIPNRLIEAEIYLLVGENEDDFVRILFLPRQGTSEPPPAMKRLRVTMRQILARLEEATIEMLYQEESTEASEEERSEIESEEVVVSTDEDEWRNYGSDGE